MIPHPALLVALTVAGCAQTPPAAQASSETGAPPPPVATTRPAEPVSAPADPETESVEDLLDRLERAADDLHDLQAEIIYRKWDNVLGREEIRKGEILFLDGDDGRRLAILLRTVITAGRQRDQHKDYIFGGSWLVEVDHKARLFLKRQIVPPGREFDPLRLGEGPFPMPLGQPRDEVLARFEVSRLDAPTDQRLASRLADRDVLGLVLVPRAGSPEAEDIERVELFYDRDTLLPAGVSLTERGGDRKTVELRNTRRNEGIDEKRLEIEEPDPGEWNIDVRPWQEAGG